MGHLMSHPVEDKTLETRAHATMSYCVGLMQGYRMSMEDAHDVRVSEDEQLAVFGVFDGHGGRYVAEQLKQRLVPHLFRRLAAARRHNGALAHYLATTRDVFFEVDAHLLEHEAAHCGATAIATALIGGRYILVANTGDLRAILLLPGGAAKTLSFDHKPYTMGERVRIENSGGYVVNGRVNEVLALLRAFGDFKFKMPWLALLPSLRHSTYLEQNRRFARDNLVALPPELFQVTVEPDLMVYDLAKQPVPEFIVLACDGIWDCYTNDQLIALVRDKLREGWSLQHITEHVLNDCISMASSVTGVGFDNMTLVLVALHPGKTLDEWTQGFART